MPMLKYFAADQIKYYLFWSLSALLLLLYFYCNYAYYGPLQLQANGIVSGTHKVMVSWDSGKGFTPYEIKSFDLEAFSSAEGGANLARPVDILFNFPQISIIRFMISVPHHAAMHLEHIALVSGHSRVELKPVAAVNSVQFEVPIKTKEFHPGLFTLQFILSTFCGWLLSQIVQLPTKINKPGWRATLRHIFFHNCNLFFWLLFICFSLAWLPWLLAYWPGTMTNDSWSTMHDVLKLKLTDWHPYIYSLYVLILMQFFNSMAAVGIFQIVSSAALLASIFSYCKKNGVHFVVLAVFILAALVSVPIGLFNTILWKDVPFSILVVLFSFIVYRVHIARETTRGPFRFPQWAWTFLIVLIAFLCNLRHNAVLFYVLIPLLFYSAITRYDFIKISMICTICFLVTQLVIPAMFGIQKTKGSPYHQMRTSVLLATHYNFFSDNRTRDMRIIEDAARIPWQKINELFPNKWFILWDSCEPKRRQWQPERGDTREYNAAFVARLISQNIPAFVASRTYEFCHSLGIDTSFSDERNAFYENPLQLHGTNLAPPGKYLFDVVIHAKRKVPAWLGDALDGYANWSRIFDSIVSPQVIVWNLVIFVFLFIVILIVSPGFSSIQFFIYPSACAALTIFLVGAGESWRYFYYIYLAGLVVVPLYLSYLKVRKQS